MMSMPGIRAGVRRLLRLPLRTRDQVHADVDEELQSYLDARIEYLVARGMSRADAADEALRRLGGTIDEARERLHHSAEDRETRMRLRERLDDAFQDIRYATRGLARRPGFTAVAVLTLAIGIGATTAIFSAVNALILRPLPYTQPDELMGVTLITPSRDGRAGNDQMVWSYPKYQIFGDAQHAFSELALYAGAQFTLSTGEVEQVRGETVGARYLATLGLAPSRGRDFDPAIDAGPGAPRQVLLSEALWQRRFNADPAVIGRTIEIDRAPYEVLGVAPHRFLGLSWDCACERSSADRVVMGMNKSACPVRTRKRRGDTPRT